MELWGLKLVNGTVTIVGAAAPEADHGKPIYLARTYPPLKQYFEAVFSRDDAIEWLRVECGAEDIIEGNLLQE